MFAWVLANPNAAMPVFADFEASALPLVQVELSHTGRGIVLLSPCHRRIFIEKRLHHAREYSEVKGKV